MEPSFKRVGFSASAAALLGTAIGKVGTIGTTAVSAHYTAKDHAADRAEARAKDRREAITKTYLAAIAGLNACAGQAVYLQNLQGPDPPLKPHVTDGLVSDDVRPALTLLGSAAAVKAYEKAMLDYGQVVVSQPHTTERYLSVARFFDSLKTFIEATRADVQSDRF